MKINNRDLGDLYKAYVVESVPLSRKNCPAIEEIINLFRAKLSKRQQIKIIDHISKCYFCSQEFEFILKTVREEKKLSNEIDNIFASKRRIYKNAVSIRKKLSSLYPIFSWKFASILTGIILIITILFSYFVFQKKDKKDYRDVNFVPIKLIEPVEGKFKKSLLKFKWVEIKGSDYYIVELFDETLFPVWKSEKIFNNYTIIPQKILISLAKNKMYFWVLTAHFPNGKNIESRVEYFTLTD